MKRAKMSFDEKRNEVSRAAAAAAEENGEKAVTKQGSFSNDDVPTFLEELKRFQVDSRAKRLLAR